MSLMTPIHFFPFNAHDNFPWCFLWTGYSWCCLLFLQKEAGSSPLCRATCVWMQALGFANKRPLYLLLGAIPPSLRPSDRHFLTIQSHSYSQFIKSLLDGQFVPKSIGNGYKKRHIFHGWWLYASLILQTLLSRPLASMPARAQQAAEAKGPWFNHLHKVSSLL